ncbi:MAG: histidine triad nucleotide-binding protein [Thermus sp.]|uniref:histidine triad nucleotide-binding protein n=1 Tax=unclassified Thermus TaxID=2619321 RepID=UPI000238A03C|nr:MULTISPECIES: histidine triad nucleotide-binding protein [unclassified Thermus]AEV15601.1 Histidine nucleotide-binding protein [Thermus sp. CCB_US3_UF1]MCS6868847.1 histidine triad nucleotide-binding protein [Thermus sp.]MCS7218401.1 histidine triad nucleotide-binding protein [Thermus sp.]MCX7849277.1 histidine triad nucleotide-binding protein [Thermus sp.]MDW8016844.1 histidine triad nucleotide-binding protein [Thermus sp.]
MDCVFCRIIRGELPSRKVYEDEGFVAFHDIRPKAPVHVLVVPKEHVAKLSDYPDTPEGEKKLGALFRTANRVARELGLEGYKLQVHVGEKGGQEVFHVHVHVMGSPA